MTDGLIESDRFRIRLRARLGMALNCQEESVSFSIFDRDIKIKSDVKGQILKDSQWIVVDARGFQTEHEAGEFGEKISTLLQLAAMCCRIGIDAGEGKPTAQMSEEFARACGMLGPRERLAPNVHGILILPDDERTRIPSFRASGVSRVSPRRLFECINAFSMNECFNLLKSSHGVRLINRALMSNDPLSKIVLAISAVEALGQNETWSHEQRNLLRKLADEVESGCESEPDMLEVAEAIRRGLHRVGLRQGVMRELARLNLLYLKEDWDKLYAIRSAIFHGTKEFSHSDLGGFADETVNLCSKIVIAVVERDGVRMYPSATGTGLL